MKYIKAIPTCILAACMLFAVLCAGNGVFAAEAEYPVDIHVMTEEERNVFDQLGEDAILTGTAFLPPNNAAGTNGNICAPFVADKPSAAFAFISTPGAVDYSVQLYRGTPGEGVYVSNYATVETNNGVWVSDLTEGEQYYFKISSNTVSPGGCTARYVLAVNWVS